MASLGETLKDARSRTGLSLKQVSEQTGITNSRLSKMERDQIPCKIDELKQLIEFYKSPVIDFFKASGCLNQEDLDAYQRVFQGVDELSFEEKEHIQRTIDLLTRRKEKQ